MFNTAQVVLDKSEWLLVNRKPKNKVIKWLSKFIGDPFSFLLLGADETFKPMINMGGIFFMALLLGLVFKYIVFNFFGVVGNVFFYLACMVAFMVTIFALPSTYADGGVKESDVTLVSDFITEDVVETIDDVALLEKNFELLFERVYSRIKFYKFATASIWGLYMYYFNLGIMIWVKNGMLDSELKIGDHLGSLIGAILFTSVAYFWVTAYKRANERLIKTIQFACIQAKYDLAE